MGSSGGAPIPDLVVPTALDNRLLEPLWDAGQGIFKLGRGTRSFLFHLFSNDHVATV